MTRQSKKVKLRKRRKTELKKAKVEKEVLGVRETTLNIYHNSGVETNNPIVLDFYKALKNQKVFGSFCSLFKMHNFFLSGAIIIMRFCYSTKKKS